MQRFSSVHAELPTSEQLVTYLATASNSLRLDATWKLLVLYSFIVLWCKLKSQPIAPSPPPQTVFAYILLLKQLFNSQKATVFA